MVSILTRIFGLAHLEIIEDAVQDTFISAMKAWRNGLPENPEAWLTAAAKNRVLDLFRQLKSAQEREEKWSSGAATIALNELFLDTEIADSQLRMIFAACHPTLKPQDQIAFALKTTAGFNAREIATALLLKEETVKKRITRARKTISESGLKFEIPAGEELLPRLMRVHEVIYLIFNEGFHSGKKTALVREDLCGEAIRLSKLLLSNKLTSTGESYALFALFCFHSSRLKSKVSEDGAVISLKDQDRSMWYRPMIELGFKMLQDAYKTALSEYHLEAAIAAEHVMAKSYDQTNWKNILNHYERLNEINPSAFTQLNMATVLIQLQRLNDARTLLEGIDQEALEQREYLYHGLWAEYFLAQGNKSMGLDRLDQAIELVNNQAERDYLLKKRLKFETATS